MLPYLLKFESGKTISNTIRLMLGFSIFSLMSIHMVLAEVDANNEPFAIPIPAPPLLRDLVHDQKKAAEQSTTIPSFDARKNAPPFDLSQAKLCEKELKRRRITFKRLDEITDPNGCIVERPLLIGSLSGGIKLSGQMTMRCEVILAMDDWTNIIVKPSALLHLEQKLTEIRTSTSYQCRTRNNKPGAKVSEHGFANGVDITGFVTEDTSVINVSPQLDKTSDKSLAHTKFQAAVRAGACSYFTSVLGPGTNTSHQDHFHFDLAYRKSGYRLCE